MPTRGRRGEGDAAGTRVLVPKGTGRGALSRRCRNRWPVTGPSASGQQGAMLQVERGGAASWRRPGGNDRSRCGVGRNHPKLGVRPHPRLENNQNQAGCGSGFRRKLTGEGVGAAGAVGRLRRGSFCLAGRAGFLGGDRQGGSVAAATEGRCHEAGRDQAGEAPKHRKLLKRMRWFLFKVDRRRSASGCPRRRAGIPPAACLPWWRAA